MNPFNRLLNRISATASTRAARREATRLQARIASIPTDLNPDQVVDFVFSPDAEIIALWQIEEEFRALIGFVADRRPRTLLEIGTADGGSLFAHTRVAPADALIISIDLPDGPFGGGYPSWRIPLYKSFVRPGQHLELLRADSHAPATAARLAEILGGRRIDYAFVDGDHSYRGVKRDFDLCRRFAAESAVIAFHDIVTKPNSAYTAEADSSTHEQWAVHDFWREIKHHFPHWEYIRDRAQEGYGIGVLHLGDDPSLADEKQSIRRGL